MWLSRTTYAANDVVPMQGALSVDTMISTRTQGLSSCRVARFARQDLSDGQNQQYPTGVRAAIRACAGGVVRAPRCIDLPPPGYASRLSGERTRRSKAMLMGLPVAALGNAGHGAEESAFQCFDIEFEVGFWLSNTARLR